MRRWQASLGVPADGIVRVGDVVYVPELPARLALAPELAPGARLGGGESAVLLLSDTPEVRVLLTADMRSDVTAGAGVRIDYGSGTWEGAVADVVAAEEPGMFEAIVVGEDGGAVCADDCATVLPIDRDVQLPGEVIVVPERRGPVVPTAAIRTDAVNKPFVVTADGRRLPVEIIASSRGVAVVSGVEPGEVVNLVGQTTAPSTP